jgi:predicted O-methyltransferase YrrM
MPNSIEQNSNDACALLATANLIGEIGEALAAGGFEGAARQLYLAANEIGLQAQVGDEWWTRPFNRQEGRRRLFLAILEAFRPDVLVETGTFKGTTARFMAEVFPGRVLTCEVNLRWFIEAQARLAQYPNVELTHGDSRAFLSELSRADGNHERALFYLDAHWLYDLPVRAEMEFIFAAWPNAVVIIDDFQVPDDAGYAFDDYGPGRR